MVELDFGRLNNLFDFVTWKKWILVDCKYVYYFLTW